MDNIEQNGEKVKVCYNTPQKIGNNMVKAAIYERGILGIDKDNNLVEIYWDSPGLTNVRKIIVLNDIKEFECTTNHYVALGMDGIVYTGGSNDVGQLGNYPNPIGNTKAIAISAGGAAYWGSTFAVTEKGKLLAWGYNEVGQLGNGRSGLQRDDEQRHLILSDVKEVVSGDYQSAYAIMFNNDLYGWGYNNGSLGVEEGGEILKTPTKILENVKTVALGGPDTLVLTNNGEVFTCYPYIGEEHEWNSFKAIVKDFAERHEKNPNFYKVFEGVKDIHSIYGSFFILYENGELWGWGDNYNCLLGIGKETDQSITEDQTIYEPLLLMENVKDITGTTFFLKEDGDVYYCGSHYPENILSPVKIASNMTKIFESEETGVYMQGEDGKLYYFDSYETDGVELIDMPISVSDISSTGWGLFIDNEKNLYEIIYVSKDEDWENRNKTQYSLLRMFGGYDDIGYYYRKIGENVISCANQRDTFYYVTENGDLFSWGSNDYGLLGIGDARQDENIFEVKLPQ